MHDSESQGAKPREHVHPRHHFLRHAHKDWRVWTVVILMLGMILVYVLTNDLSLVPGRRPRTPTPAAGGP